MRACRNVKNLPPSPSLLLFPGAPTSRYKYAPTKRKCLRQKRHPQGFNRKSNQEQNKSPSAARFEKEEKKDLSRLDIMRPIPFRDIQINK